MGCTRQGPFQGASISHFGKNLILPPLKVALQQVKTGKFHFRKGLGRVGQSWQGFGPASRKLPNPIITRGSDRSRHARRWILTETSF